jgi:hypothetical protein
MRHEKQQPIFRSGGHCRIQPNRVNLRRNAVGSACPSRDSTRHKARPGSSLTHGKACLGYGLTHGEGSGRAGDEACQTSVFATCRFTDARAESRPYTRQTDGARPHAHPSDAHPRPKKTNRSASRSVGECEADRSKTDHAKGTGRQNTGDQNGDAPREDRHATCEDGEGGGAYSRASGACSGRKTQSKRVRSQSSRAQSSALKNGGAR